MLYYQEELEPDVEPGQEELQESEPHRHTCELCSTEFHCICSDASGHKYKVCELCELDPLGANNGH